MPYKLSKKDEKYCVMNSDTGENKGCSDSRKMAVAHMRKLYMVEGESKKELAMTPSDIEGMIIKAAAQFTLETGESFEEDDLIVDKSYYGEMAVEAYAAPLYGATSYADVEAQDAAFKQTMEVEDLVWKLGPLTRNILANPEIKDKGKAIEGLASELATRIKAIKAGKDDDTKELNGVGEEKNTEEAEETGVEDSVEEGEKADSGETDSSVTPNKSLLDKIIVAVKSIFDKPEPEEHGIMFWKEADGQMWWLARYSNNFIDDDNPPDIISEKSHRRFVEMVDKGVYPYPELQIWHNKEWNIGKAVWCAYDDSGFAIAAGTINPGCEPIAEALSQLKEVGLSHGMPIASIVRDPTDNRVIVEHQTKEISVLPLSAAANKLTSFFVLKEEEAEMPIPNDKKAEALNKWGLSATLLTTVESLNKATADLAAKNGLETKEKEEEVNSETQTTTPPVETEVPAEDGNLSEEILNGSPTRKELSDAIAPYFQKMNQMFEVVEKLTAEVVALKELREQDKANAEKAKAEETINRMSPTAALLSMFGGSAIGNPATQVKEGDPLVNSKPKEQPNVELRTGIEFIDVMLSQPNGG